MKAYVGTKMRVIPDIQRPKARILLANDEDGLHEYYYIFDFCEAVVI